MTSKRLPWLLAALALVALVVLFDTPPAAPEVSEVVTRGPRAAVRAAVVVPAPLVVSLDAPVPDLFAGAPGVQPAAAVAQVGAQLGTTSERDGDPEEPAFRLLGFKEEDGQRAAYLEHEGQLLTAQRGATLAGQYRVLKVGQEQVEIRDNRSGATQRIGFRDTQ